MHVVKESKVSINNRQVKVLDFVADQVTIEMNDLSFLAQLLNYEITYGPYKNYDKAKSIYMFFNRGNISQKYTLEFNISDQGKLSSILLYSNYGYIIKKEGSIDPAEVICELKKIL